MAIAEIDPDDADVSPETNALTYAIIGAAMEVHRALGPGLLESGYRACLVQELLVRGHRVETEVPLPIVYRGASVGVGYRADLRVDGAAIVELKSVETVLEVHALQTITYLRLSGCPVGLLINFNVPLLKQGVRRFANTRPRS